MPAWTIGGPADSRSPGYGRCDSKHAFFRRASYFTRLSTHLQGKNQIEDCI